MLPLIFSRTEPVSHNYSASLHSGITHTTLEPVLLSTAVVEASADDAVASTVTYQIHFIKTKRFSTLQSTYSVV